MWKTYLWQNFLIDQPAIDFLIDHLKNLKNKWNYKIALEIGPGKWALTKHLVQIFDKVIVFEKDTSFDKILQNILTSRWTIIRWDVLESDVLSLLARENINLNEVLVVWNLPYYITSPIFRKFFVDLKVFNNWVFLIQKEVWEKIETTARKKSFLWWLLNYSYAVNYLRTVPAEAFDPPPKVESCFVELEKHDPQNIELEKLIELLNQISPYKRKTLWKIWKMIWRDKNELKAGLESKRLEELSWEEIIELIRR